MSVCVYTCGYVSPLRVYVLKVLILPFTMVLGQNDRLRKDSLQKRDEKKEVSEFAYLAQKWSKIAQRKKVDIGVFANHRTVHSGGISSGRVRGCG